MKILSGKCLPQRARKESNVHLFLVPNPKQCSVPPPPSSPSGWTAPDVLQSFNDSL